MPLGELSAKGLDPTRRGVYGFAVDGLRGAADLLHRPPADSPVVAVHRHVDAVADPAEVFRADFARFALQGDAGHVEIVRDPLTVRLYLPSGLSDAVAVHPFLAVAAATVNRWLGRLCLHGGAFAGERGAYALLGDKEAGKTSTLAALHQAGFAIVTDDVLVIDRTDALTGPTCIDLRRETADWFGDDCTALGVVGQRERFRARTRPAAWRTPLRGFVVPVWGDAVALTPIPVEQRLKLLFANQSLMVPPQNPEAMLDLARLEFWQLRRPRSLSSLTATTELLQSL